MAGTTATPETPVAEQALTLLEERLAEIKPFRDEANQIEDILQRIKAPAPEANGNGRQAAQPVAPAKPKTASKSGNKSSGTRASGSASEPKAGTRAADLLKVIRDNPGVTIADAAKALGLNQANYAYRIKDRLQADGLVRQEGNGFVAVA
jgi:hypothetical protein